MQINLPANWPTAAQNEKGRMLYREAFAHDLDPSVFVRHAAPRKVFSVRWIEDHSEADLRAALDSRSGDPEFYFSNPPPQGTQVALARKYGWVK
jgi:hypothetical protein